MVDQLLCITVLEGSGIGVYKPNFNDGDPGWTAKRAFPLGDSTCDATRISGKFRPPALHLACEFLEPKHGNPLAT